MELKDLVLTVIPAGLAILMEACNPLNDRYFEKQADEIVRAQLGAATQPEAAQAIKSMPVLLRECAGAAASLSGLAPTIVSFFVSAAAVFVSVRHPYWWMLGLLVMLIVVGAIALRIVAQRSLFELSTLPFNAPLINRLRPTTLFSFLIYISNAVLIILAALIYCNVIG
jgi:threonine/homoserine/homoserine lactone efflux protein